MSSEAQRLFYRETTYVSEATDQGAVFAEVAEKLREKDLVKDAFLENIIEREAGYPTGMDMSPIDPRIPNFAVPHTEVEFVNTCRIVPIKLVHPVRWHNMIDPNASFDVSFLFMILNDDADAQVGLLAKIMDFVNGLGVEGARSFFALTDPDAIYGYLEEHFPEE